MRIAALLAAALAMGSTALAHGADTKPTFDRQERWGAPWLLAEPAYPKELLAGNVSGAVDLEARVSGTGELKELELRPATPESAPFVEAVRAVAFAWRFYAPLGDDCLPSAERIQVRISFEIDAGKPHIFVSRGRRTLPDMAKVRPVQHRHPRYPRSMLWMGREALLFARIEIDPQGHVASVSATAFPRELAPQLFDFESETIDALRGWTFNRAAEGETEPRFYCTDVVFSIHD